MRWVALLYTVLRTGRAKSPLGIGRGRGNRPDDASATGSAGHGAKPAEPAGSDDGERTTKGEPMPATHLRCTQCGTETALEGVSACERCFAPLEPVYDLDASAGRLTRERIVAGPPSLWRYAPLLPVAPPEPALLAPGFTPLVAAPRLADELGIGELYLKLDTANPTHSFKDRVVAVACREGAGARPRGARVRVDREPRERRRGAGRGRGHARGDLLPGGRRAREARLRAPRTARHLRRPRQLRRVQPADDRALLRAALGVRQRHAPRLLRRGLEDARVRGRRAARLGAARRRRRPRRLGLAALKRTERGFEDFRALGLVRRRRRRG